MNNDDSKVVLASQSPRRVELLKEIFNQFEVAPSSIEEVLDIGITSRRKCQNLARAKAESIAPTSRLWVIRADTLLTLDNEILET